MSGEPGDPCGNIHFGLPMMRAWLIVTTDMTVNIRNGRSPPPALLTMAVLDGLNRITVAVFDGTT
jgi:hypothetical protein